MRDLDGCAGLCSDAQRLVDRLVDPVHLVAHVRDVRNAVLGRDPRQLDQLLGRRVRTRRIDQT